MDKCWFVLKQNHYPPPRLPKRGIGIANGAISLGHIIPSLSELDGVINRNEAGIKFTPAVQIYHTESWGLDWKRDKGLKAMLATDATAPVGAGTPFSAKQRVKAAFARTEKNHQEFDTLDRYIIQVDRKFIGKILEDEEVGKHVERTRGFQLLGQLGGQWSVFMITGITVARGAKGEFGESKKFEATSSTKANVANAASAGASVNFSNSNTSSSSAQKTSDFVWAVRLTKIWKGAVDNDWNFETVSKGATFSMNDEKPWRDEIERALSQESFDIGAFQTFDLPDEESMIIY